MKAHQSDPFDLPPVTHGTEPHNSPQRTELLERDLEAAAARIAELEAACRLALDWCTGEGQFAAGRDNLYELAEIVVPALERALNPDRRQGE